MSLQLLSPKAIEVKFWTQNKIRTHTSELARIEILPHFFVIKKGPQIIMSRSKNLEVDCN